MAIQKIADVGLENTKGISWMMYFLNREETHRDSIYIYILMYIHIEYAKEVQLESVIMAIYCYLVAFIAEGHGMMTNQWDDFLR